MVTTGRQTQGTGMTEKKRIPVVDGAGIEFDQQMPGGGTGRFGDVAPLKFSLRVDTQGFHDRFLPIGCEETYRHADFSQVRIFLLVSTYGFFKPLPCRFYHSHHGRSLEGTSDLGLDPARAAALFRTAPCLPACQRPHPLQGTERTGILGADITAGVSGDTPKDRIQPDSTRAHPGAADGRDGPMGAQASQRDYRAGDAGTKAETRRQGSTACPLTSGGGEAVPCPDPGLRRACHAGSRTDASHPWTDRAHALACTGAAPAMAARRPRIGSEPRRPAGHPASMPHAARYFLRSAMPSSVHIQPKS